MELNPNLDLSDTTYYQWKTVEQELFEQFLEQALTKKTDTKSTTNE
jgi:hypothetical protein